MGQSLKRIDPRTGKPVQRREPEVASTCSQLDISPTKVLVRGATGHCPLCGSGGLFRRLVVIRDACPRCGLIFEREHGTVLGAIGMSTMVTFASTFVFIAAAVLLTAPEVPAVPIAIAACVWILVVSIIGSPFTRTLWLAIDLLMSPLRDSEAPHLDRTRGERNHREAPKLRSRRPDLN